MRVVIALEQRFLGTPDGAVWTDGLYPRPFWDRYLAVFDAVTVLARVRPVEGPAPQWRRVDDALVQVHAVPDYQGPSQYLQRRSRIRHAVREAVEQDAGFILRVPGMISNLAASMLGERGRPLNLEVLGDPGDVFAPGVSRHPLRSFFRWYYPSTLRWQCATAQNVMYVTQEFLQRRYPPRGGRGVSSSTGVSDVELDESAFAVPDAQRGHRVVAGPLPALEVPKRPVRIASIGAMNQPYKGFSDLIAAVALCRTSQVELALTIIGDGPLRPQFERQAQALGVDGQIRFAGQLPAGQAIRDELDQAEIYLQPSLVEGLPRSLVEAMARGRPCIATEVGGIPELLPPEFLVPPRRPARLAMAIKALAGDPARQREASQRNLDVARTFSEKALAPRRLAFYRKVLSDHQAWLEGQRQSG